MDNKLIKMNNFQKSQAAKMLSCYNNAEDILEKAHPVGYTNKYGQQKQADGTWKYVGKGSAQQSSNKQAEQGSSDSGKKESADVFDRGDEIVVGRYKMAVSGYTDDGRLKVMNAQGEKFTLSKTQTEKAERQANPKQPRSSEDDQEVRDDRKWRDWESGMRSALKKRFNDPEDQEAHDEVENLVKEMLKQAGMPEDEIEDNNWMEDEMLGGGDHNDIKETMKYLRELKQDVENDFKKAQNIIKSPW